MKKVRACEIYHIIEKQSSSKNNKLSVQELCDFGKVSRSGYYSFLSHKENRIEREKNDLKDFSLIKQAYDYKNYPKGAKSIYMQMLHQGKLMNLKKIRRLMKKFSLKCIIRRKNPYKQIAKATKENQTFANILNRDFKKGVRKVLLTDITYLKFHGKFSYLSTILDAYTKEILAYELSQNLRLEFVLNTVKKLIEQYGCSLDDNVIIHSDQGVHYTSKDFVNLLKNEDFLQSMSRKGNCWDNSPQESFFGHMKDEISDKIAKCTEHNEVVNTVDDWIYYYNNERYQWDLLKLSPIQFYNYCISGINPLDILKN